MQLKQSYFMDLTASLSHYLPVKQSNFLKSEAYSNLFENVKNQFNAVEHYLLDFNGSTLFIKHDGSPIWLIIKQESELQDFEIIARDQEAPEHFIEKLTSREMIPFFFTDNDYQYLSNDWVNSFILLIVYHNQIITMRLSMDILNKI